MSWGGNSCISLNTCGPVSVTNRAFPISSVEFSCENATASPAAMPQGPSVAAAPPGPGRDATRDASSCPPPAGPGGACPPREGPRSALTGLAAERCARSRGFTSAALGPCAGRGHLSPSPAPPAQPGTAPPAPLPPQHPAGPDGRRSRRSGLAPRGRPRVRAGEGRAEPRGPGPAAGMRQPRGGGGPRPLPARPHGRRWGGRGGGAAGSGDVSHRPRPLPGYIRGGAHAVGLFRYGFAAAVQVRRVRAGQAGAGAGPGWGPAGPRTLRVR